MGSTLMLLANYSHAVHNIMDYGAIPDLDDVATAFKNGDAFAAAIEAANAEGELDREVHIPADHKFTFMPVAATGLRNITITVDGLLLASTAHRHYPV